MNSRTKHLLIAATTILMVTIMTVPVEIDAGTGGLSGSGTPEDPYYGTGDYASAFSLDSIDGKYVLVGTKVSEMRSIKDGSLTEVKNCTFSNTGNIGDRFMNLTFDTVGTASYYDNYDGQYHYIYVLAEAVTKHTVSFSSNGTIIQTQTVDVGGTATCYEPTLDGCTFGGWYSDSGFTTPFDFDTVISADTTLYAKWIENPVTITFYVEGQIHSTLQVPKGSVGIVYTPIMVEGIFAGWYYDSAMTQKYDATRSLDSDTNLYALGVPPLVFTSEPSASAVIAQVDYGTFFFDATESSGRYQIHWDFGDGNTSSDPIAYNTYSAPGKYTVTLTITNIYGESTTATYFVEYGENATGGGDNDLRYILIALLCIIGGGLVIRRIL